MYFEERKTHLIEEVQKIESEAVLLEIETVLSKHSKATKTVSIYDFVGIISKEEAAEMNKAIEESCERVDENDWK